MAFSTLWQSPAVNPMNGKALSVPALNPIDKYGRTLYASTIGFMVAFLSWYAFPPLLTITIKKDLHLSQNEIANSNIVALVATLLVRIVIGPLCDQFGPRRCFAGILLIGAIPTALAGTVTSATDLIVLRFFIGVLGGSFVPCQVWVTGFYDKSVVGYANALAAGIGNSGGGITYFVMPAIFDSLVAKQHLTAHTAWRVAFIVPFVLITAIAFILLFFCEDTPTGSWSERQTTLNPGVPKTPSNGTDVTASGRLVDTATAGERKLDPHEKLNNEKPDVESHEIDIGETEIIQKPTFREAIAVIFSLQCLSLSVQYAASFGGELSINSILGSYYAKNFPALGQTGSGNWAAMFGLLNAVFRPIGGFLSDVFYRKAGSVWAKKVWLVFLSIVMGAFCVAIGAVDSHSKSTMFGLVAGLAFFLEAANGANYSLVPHVFPFANGIVSGVVGASGNLGGIIFAIIFRYNGTDYGRVFWILGIVMIGVNVAVCWIRPVSTKHIVGK